MAFNNEIEKTKKEIEVLTAKLALLEEIENHKTPCEIAYKNVYGVYPMTDIGDGYWENFQAGYHLAYEENVKETAQERGERLHKDVERVVKESVKWCEEHPNENPLDWLKPQTEKQVENGLKEAFREAVKQGVVSSVDKPKDDFMDRMVAELKGQTLYDVCVEWCDDDTDPPVSDLISRIEKWLPKPQSAANSQNAYVECAVEGYNDCLNKIRRKLR